MPGPLLSDWSLPLRAWQREAYERWNAEQPADALIVATPGAGKTRFAARLAHALLRAGRVSRVIAVVPREHLKAQVARAMAEAGVVLDHAFSNAAGALASDVHGAVVTYQQVAFAPNVYKKLIGSEDRRVAVLLDEVHHAGDQATWGEALRDAFGRADFRISLSGTPFRSDGTAIPFVSYQTGMSVADYSYDYASALRDGVCRALVFPLHGGEAEWISRDGEQMRASFDAGLARRHESERLRTALTQPNWVGDVLQKAHLRLLSVRAGGHRDAGGLVAAMNQDHARFIADLMRKRIGIDPAIVVSDMDDTSRRIGRFARSSEPWIVAVHMISEGVDIPRLRVGVFASNVVTEMYFRQFCGRFVRTIGGRIDEREAFVFVPDDHRIRSLASRITVDVRTAIRERDELEEVAALAQAQRAERASDEGLYHSIAANATEGRVLDFGPLFNPEKHYAQEDRIAVEAVQPVVAKRREALPLTNAERKEALRRSLHSLVSRVSSQFGVDHRLIHATLNQRCGGSVATASERELETRKRLAENWLVRRMYDGLR
ncbi:MAG: DEAD/DEAH box helicase [Candidatus Velthaea sp.]